MLHYLITYGLKGGKEFNEVVEARSQEDATQQAVMKAITQYDDKHGLDDSPIEISDESEFDETMDDLIGNKMNEIVYSAVEYDKVKHANWGLSGNRRLRKI